jgi:2Fe-2S ferredoxin
MGKVMFLPSQKSIQARPGQTILRVAAAARAAIPQRCSGRASCLMCRVVLEEGELTAPTDLERRKLSPHDLEANIRLACQARTTERNCTLRIPESRLKSVVQAALEKERRKKEEKE